MGMIIFDLGGNVRFIPQRQFCLPKDSPRNEIIYNFHISNSRTKPTVLNFQCQIKERRKTKLSLLKRALPRVFQNRCNANRFLWYCVCKQFCYFSRQIWCIFPEFWVDNISEIHMKLLRWVSSKSFLVHQTVYESFAVSAFGYNIISNYRKVASINLF